MHSTESLSRYAQRIAVVIEYIRAHLTDDLSLETLAQVAHFSPYHFHRIFTDFAGETLNDCVNRLRLERAAALMKADVRLPVWRAAAEAGFQRAETFSRAFRRQYGITARAWDRVTALQERKNRQVQSEFPFYSREALEQVSASGEFPVTLRDMPAHMFAFIRVHDSYQAGNLLAAYDRLQVWARSHGLDPLALTLVGASQDDPDMTPAALCSYDIGYVLPKAFTAMPLDGDVMVTHVPASTLASIHCAGDIFVVDRAWQYLYRWWLPRSAFVPDNRPAMEMYRRHPAEIGWEVYDLDCVVPVTRL